MRVTRINQRPNDAKDALKREKRPYRKIKRLVRESDIPKVTDVTNPLNQPNRFTYIDFERNKGAINMIKHQVEQAISNYGIDLTYFRKYNTFFKGEDENNSNLIYGEDTTAEFYASGTIRAYVSIDNMGWNFNQIGLEATEQINLYITIDNFEQSFANKIGKIETKEIEIPMSGNTINHEVTGMIREPEFQAFAYSEFDDKLRLINPKLHMIDKEVNDSFYLTKKYTTNEYALSADMTGRLKYDDQHPFSVYGLMYGKVSYHSLDNIEDSSTWGLAPQVGDYFRMTTPTGITEEWEVSNVYDRNLTKSGINPLLGKYIYQIAAVRRVESYEKNTEELNYKEPGNDINEILGSFTDDSNEHQQYADQYVKKKDKNVHNKKTTQLGKNVYNYQDKSDEVYGRNSE